MPDGPGLTRRAGLARAALVAAPLLAYFAMLARLWFDAPIWDDYDTILRSANAMHDAATPAGWWAALLAQHNDHRIVVMRLVTQASILLTGGVDFRALMAIGNLAVVGVFAIACLAFRETATAAAIAAAAFLQFQWSYYEATLMASAAVPNLGVIFFSLACLAMATRAGAAAAAACVAFGLLAAGSQTNGLLALPLAAIAAFLAGRRPRAALLAMAALVLWGLHFTHYTRMPNQPSLTAAFGDPVTAAKLFVVVLGSAWTGVRGAALLGLAVVAALAWLTLKGAWRKHPAAGWLVAFLVLSAGAAAAARTGLGVHHASRYAIYSSTLLATILLAAHSLGGPWRRAPSAGVLAACVAACVGFSALAWPYVVDRSFRGHLLAMPEPALSADAPRYAGILFPHHGYATNVLDRSAQLGYYAPPRRATQPAVVEGSPAGALPARLGGHVDSVPRNGPRLAVVGWSVLPAEVPGRRFVVSPAAGLVGARYAGAAREDVALHHGNGSFLLSGFRLDLDFESESSAQQAMDQLCVAVDAPGRDAVRLLRPGVACG